MEGWRSNSLASAIPTHPAIKNDVVVRYKLKRKIITPHALLSAIMHPIVVPVLGAVDCDGASSWIRLAWRAAVVGVDACVVVAN